VWDHKYLLKSRVREGRRGKKREEEGRRGKKREEEGRRGKKREEEGRGLHSRSSYGEEVTKICFAKVFRGQTSVNSKGV